MYEVVNVTTKKSEGVFATYEKAFVWVMAHGGTALFRIFPW